MGITYLDGTVTGPAGKSRSIHFLVDSGATYTVLPEDDWQSMNLIPKRSMVFTLADGSTIQRDISECHITLPQGDGQTPVVLGEPGDEALLGVVTLEILGLVLNPFNRTLQPMKILLG